MNKRPLPEMPRVDRVSPSAFTTLRACFLRFGLDRARNQNLDRISNTAAILGTIAHYVVEQASVSRTRPSDETACRALSEKFWNEELARQISNLKTRTFDRHLLHAEKWPFYYLRRASALRVGASILRTHGASIQPAIRPPQVEQAIESERLAIKGRLDRVEFAADGPVIIDWKSRLGGDSEGVSEQYRNQMLLYAAAYHDKTGEWPRRAKLVAFGGESAEFVIVPKEASALAEEARKLLSDYNKAVATQPIETLAKPSPEACEYCDYRGICDRYWAGETLASDFEGAVISVQNSPALTRWSFVLEVTIDENEGILELSNLDPLQFFYLAGLRPRQKVRAVSFFRSPANEGKLLASARSYVVISNQVS